MKLRIATLLSCLALCIICSAVTFLECDFEEPWAPTPAGQHPAYGVRTAPLPADFTIVEETGNHHLHMVRSKYLAFADFTQGYNIPALRDFTFSIRVRRPQNAAGYFFFTTHDNQPRLGVSVEKSNDILAFDVNGEWVSTGIPLPPSGEWFAISVQASVSERSYVVTIVRADGTSQSSNPIPYRADDGLRKVRLGNVPPAGTCCDWDDLKLQVADDLNLQNREDPATDAVAHLGSQQIPGFRDGCFEPPLEVPGGGEVTVNFPRPSQTCGIVLRAESLSGRPVKVELFVSNAAGSGETKWSEGWLQPGANQSFQRIFTMDNLLRARIAFPTMGAVRISEIHFVGLPVASRGEKEQRFLETVYGEFRCPVWQDQSTAKLHLINAGKAPHAIRLTGTPRHDEKSTSIPLRELTLAPGETVVEIPLSGLPAGDHAVTIADASGASQASFRRLLRYYPLPATPQPTGPIGDVTGQKLLFPDGHYLESSRNVTYLGTQAKHVQIVPESQNYEDFVRYGLDFGRNAKGQMQAYYYTLNRKWDADSKVYMRATCIDEAAGKWEYARLDGPPPRDLRTLRIGEQYPPELRPDWDAKTAKEHFEMYDPSRDGAPDLHQIKFRYTGAVANNTVMWKGTSQDWGCIQVPPRTTFPIWRVSPEKTLVMQDKPFLRDHESFGEFEDEDATHDNFVGQWLADGGRKLCFAHGRWLKTYPPFQSPAYDNMRGLRILGLWVTEDVKHYALTGLIPPDESDPPLCQQYGGQILRLAKANGLMLGFILRYRSDAQQMDTVLAYSWDGIVWRRVKGPAFLPCGKPGSWDAGAISFYNDHPFRCAIGAGDQTRLFVSDVDAYYHHEAADLVVCEPVATGQLTAEYVKQTLGKRDLEQWPYFQEIGGYEGLARHARTAGKSISYAEYRTDGFFYLTAESAAEAQLLTRPLSATGALDANLAVGPNGFAEIALLDADGKELPGYRKRLPGGTDGIAIRIFNQLPQGNFKIQIRFQDARLYAICL